MATEIAKENRDENQHIEGGIQKRQTKEASQERTSGALPDVQRPREANGENGFRRDRMSEQAFPSVEVEVVDGTEYRGYHLGMTLRDYLAAHALTGLLATEAGPWQSKRDAEVFLGIDEYDCAIHFPLFSAKMAYRLADAMIAERNGETA